jgi:hypothetical protein
MRRNFGRFLFNRDPTSRTTSSIACPREVAHYISHAT